MNWNDHKDIALKLLRHKGDDFTPKLIDKTSDSELKRLIAAACGLKTADESYSDRHLRAIRSAWVERWVWGNKNG